MSTFTAAGRSERQVLEDGGDDAGRWRRAAHVAGEDADTGGRVNRFPQSSGFFVEAASGV